MANSANTGTFCTWFQRWFCEGQANDTTLRSAAKEYNRSSSSPEQDEETLVVVPASRVDRHRKMFALFLPVFVVHALWWSYMGTNDKFGIFTELSGANGIPRWYMSITMVSGGKGRWRVFIVDLNVLPAF